MSIFRKPETQRRISFPYINVIVTNLFLSVDVVQLPECTLARKGHSRISFGSASMSLIPLRQSTLQVMML